MNKLQTKVLHRLLDSYEQSRTFQGENKVNQSFRVEIGKIFPKYKDDAEYDFFCEVNEGLRELEQQSLISLEKEKNGTLKCAVLNLDRLDRCYEILDRTPRKEEQVQILALLEEILESIKRDEQCTRMQPLFDYLETQKVRLAKNRKVEYYEKNCEDYRELLFLTREVLRNQEEIFVRNFSMRLFHDSKRAEQLSGRVCALLYQYGEYEEKETVLEECGIVHTPTYVMMKGNGRLLLGEQILDLSHMPGDIALSTTSLGNLRRIEVLGKRVVTIENLTSFHNYRNAGDFAIYLGGFHNQVKRDFLIFLYGQNQGKEYRHFGDIDAGGFYILEHLKRKTGIPFRSLYMDKDTLCRYRSDTKKLSANDRKRLKLLIKASEQREQEGTLQEDYRGVLNYMLKQDCKLEQEAVEEMEELKEEIGMVCQLNAI